MSYKDGGYESRYIIIDRKTGKQVEDTEYFVLHFTTDPHALVALVTYAANVRAENPTLADDLSNIICNFYHKDEVS